MTRDISNLAKKLDAPPLDPRLGTLEESVFKQIDQRKHARKLRRQTFALQLACVVLAFAAGWLRAEASTNEAADPGWAQMAIHLLLGERTS